MNKHGVEEKDTFEDHVDGFILEDLPDFIQEYGVGQNQSLAQNEGTKLFNAVVITVWVKFWGPLTRCDEAHGRKGLRRMLDAVVPGLTDRQADSKITWAFRLWRDENMCNEAKRLNRDKHGSLATPLADVGGPGPSIQHGYYPQVLKRSQKVVAFCRENPDSQQAKKQKQNQKLSQARVAQRADEQLLMQTENIFTAMGDLDSNWLCGELAEKLECAQNEVCPLIRSVLYTSCTPVTADSSGEGATRAAGVPGALKG